MWTVCVSWFKFPSGTLGCLIAGVLWTLLWSVKTRNSLDGHESKGKSALNLNSLGCSCSAISTSTVGMSGLGSHFGCRVSRSFWAACRHFTGWGHPFCLAFLQGGHAQFDLGECWRPWVSVVYLRSSPTVWKLWTCRRHVAYLPLFLGDFVISWRLWNQIGICLHSSLWGRGGFRSTLNFFATRNMSHIAWGRVECFPTFMVQDCRKGFTLDISSGTFWDVGMFLLISESATFAHFGLWSLSARYDFSFISLMASLRALRFRIFFPPLLLGKFMVSAFTIGEASSLFWGALDHRFTNQCTGYLCGRYLNTRQAPGR